MQDKQEVFRSVYRGRQSALHHMAYMRMAKVLFALDVLARTGISLSGKRILDYGFGAGTFLRYCPEDAELSGVEIDPENVGAAEAMLRARGLTNLHLAPIAIERWREHPLLARQYDVILCSHVLEHLDDPVDFLRVVRRALAPGGAFVGIVPINELADNPAHVQKVDRDVSEAWAQRADMGMEGYFEADHLFYWVQPLSTHFSGWQHKLLQVFSLAFGVPATLLGPRRWWQLDASAGRLLQCKPAQAAFVLRAR